MASGTITFGLFSDTTAAADNLANAVNGNNPVTIVNSAGQVVVFLTDLAVVANPYKVEMEAMAATGTFVQVQYESSQTGQIDNSQFYSVVAAGMVLFTCAFFPPLAIGEVLVLIGWTSAIGSVISGPNFLAVSNWVLTQAKNVWNHRLDAYSSRVDLNMHGTWNAQSQFTPYLRPGLLKVRQGTVEITFLPDDPPVSDASGNAGGDGGSMGSGGSGGSVPDPEPDTGGGGGGNVKIIQM
ncbi:hypothetical protein [Collimonas pratensis]|uniref:hypothetical protein n=1 Tax=Collimonas pratensis TaxID=279113 RepID=UPI000A5CDA84|nr:hypothetical protein [Collimonas pratensis]